MKSVLGAVVAAVCLSGCAGYRLGDVKPQYLSGIHTLAVPMFRNATYSPRVEALVTSTVIKQLQQDGTYKITTADKADAVLEGTVVSIGRGAVRSVRGNVLATNEFNLSITVAYTVRNKNGTPAVGPAAISGTTSFFVGTDVTTEERQALPLASEDLAVRLVSQLSEGW